MYTNEDLRRRDHRCGGQAAVVDGKRRGLQWFAQTNTADSKALSAQKATTFSSMHDLASEVYTAAL